MRVAAILVVLGLIFMGMMSQNIVVSEAYAAGGSSGGSSTNASEYLQQVVNRLMLVLRIIAYGIVAVLWVIKVVIPISSSDPQRKAEAKDAIKDLAIATIIIVMAVEGMIWMIFHWIAMGT